MLFYFLKSGANSEHCQKAKTQRLAKIVYGFLPLTIFPKNSILDALQGSEYLSASIYL